MAIASNRFGIKEVADVTFYDINGETDAGVIKGNEVLKFDTLKVSNIESTAENSEARGGKGNAALISWDYGREITVTLEDALLSMETLALLFENDVVPATVGNTKEVVINANTFPGTYYVEGTTFARNEADGKDHVFKFIIPKAKVQSETTLTMEAEGDPTVIGMTLKVLRCKNGEMMKLVREDDAYNGATVEYSATLYHANGKVETYVGGADNKITLPTASTGNKWVAKGTTTALTGEQTLIGNMVYEEVTSA